MGPKGRIAFIHALAHIELNAIDLGWDAVYRFRGLPADFYRDWVQVADDEARHFVLLRDRLRALGCDYGDFDAHNGLWEMTEKTAHDGLARMALHQQRDGAPALRRELKPPRRRHADAPRLPNHRA